MAYRKKKSNFISGFFSVIALVLVCGVLLSVFNLIPKSKPDVEEEPAVPQLYALELINKNDVIVSGDYVWTDGQDVYYSNSSTQLVLNQETFTWEEKTWIFPDDVKVFSAIQIWTDGENIYYSSSSFDLVLDKETSTWLKKEWKFIGEEIKLQGYRIWSCADYVFYSNGETSQYVLDKATDTWHSFAWSGFNNIFASGIWTDGENTYYSQSISQYVLDLETFTWVESSFIGMPYFNGECIWTDGNYIYYSSSTCQSILVGNNWVRKYWYGLSYFPVATNQSANVYSGVWTDGTNYYLTWNNATYKFVYRYIDEV